MSTTPERTRAAFAPRPRGAKLITVTLIVFGSYALGLGLFMLFFPGAFFDTIGTFGVRNDHYISDNATFEIPQGLLLLAAVRRPSWRVPALAFATVHWALHSISHIVDPHHGAGDVIGWLEAGGLVATTVILAFALRTAAREAR